MKNLFRNFVLGTCRHKDLSAEARLTRSDLKHREMGHKILNFIRADFFNKSDYAFYMEEYDAFWTITDSTRSQIGHFLTDLGSIMQN